ncbi:TIGR03560 family F420-dependent LLM class oxidoreductase [Kineococcus rubinsiae]|uniref:TIGR03560 family F420-dependent LLM class oxidoreductase n=1 Tax=Kineococcus rubinsiae TaxID=2609562 RepID=UPI00142FB8DD|nr:TIGR03560 family F420-dependent LLM class oxidoreductase [Kineococcus rubinsiae]NIZ92132.1 TIGR03560 family F420-dependent LLM class oxidoreductase [Kineococcus rubinsiae]
MEFRVLTEPQEGATYGDLLALARVSEAAGYDGFSRSDHLMAIVSSGLPGPTEAWTTLAGLARDTTRLRLGTLVSPVTFRLPGPLAVQVAQVHEMSGGRVELGLGAGWYAGEHTAWGIPFPGVRERFDRLEEQLAIITGLWATPADRTFSFSGRHHALRDCPGLAHPVLPPPPIVVGGGGRRRTPQLAARYAGEFNVNFASVEETGAQFARVRDACVAIGRPVGEIAFSTAQTVCVGRDAAEVARRAAAVPPLPYPWRERGLVGSPAEVVDRLGRWAQVGVDRVYLQVVDLGDLDQLELFAADVVPQTR